MTTTYIVNKYLFIYTKYGFIKYEINISYN